MSVEEEGYVSACDPECPRCWTYSSKLYREKKASLVAARGTCGAYNPGWVHDTFPCDRPADHPPDHHEAPTTTGGICAWPVASNAHYGKKGLDYGC